MVLLEIHISLEILFVIIATPSIDRTGGTEDSLKKAEKMGNKVILLMPEIKDDIDLDIFCF